MEVVFSLADNKEEIERLKAWIRSIKENIPFYWNVELTGTRALIRCGSSVDKSEIERIYKFCDAINGKYNDEEFKLYANDNRIIFEFTSDEGDKLYNLFDKATRDTSSTVKRIVINDTLILVELDTLGSSLKDLIDVLDRLKSVLNVLVGNDIDVRFWNRGLQIIAHIRR